MNFFTKFLPITAMFIFAGTLSAQRLEDVLATSTGKSYTVANLSPRGQKVYMEQRQSISEARSRLLSEMAAEILLEMEAKTLNSDPEKLIAAQRAKIAEPTAAQIRAVYDKNQAALAGRSLEAVRPQIVEFLKHDAEQKAVQSYMDGLRAKHKIVPGKDVNTVGLGPNEIVITIGSRPVTYSEFERANRFRLNDTAIHIFEELKGELDMLILNTLAQEESKARNIDVPTFIATEVTDKLREFTDEERASVEGDLMRRLFTKYNVKFLLPEPAAIVQNVSVDDDPSIGPAAAPVTVVMFTDFQCPACARTHPVLKRVLAEYKDRVRVVVRDFPLENIHDNAFNAALAVNAARAQGRFIEYAEVLYRNQEALDRASLVRYAEELGLNVKQFELDFSDAKTASEVRKDISDGRLYGATGTPTIFVNGVKVHSLSVVGFRNAIDKALKK